MSGYYKGKLVRGALRLAINDHSTAFAQLERELAFLRAVTELPTVDLLGPQYDRVVALRDQLEKERTDLVVGFVENWVKDPNEPVVTRES